MGHTLWLGVQISANPLKAVWHYKLQLNMCIPYYNLANLVTHAREMHHMSEDRWSRMLIEAVFPIAPKWKQLSLHH